MNFAKKYGIPIIFIALWCIITLYKVFIHSTWSDEAHAWNIAQVLNFVDIIKYMQVEGHTFTWYLCIMPFAKLNLGYPYSMLLLNWFFCLIAILILWFKAPFNTFIKVLIIFSFPFLSYFPVIARCYSIGLVFLFALLALDKVKLKHSNTYALLLILLANTSVLALFGATVLGVNFVVDLIKNKVKSFYPYLILFIGVLSIYIQLGHVIAPSSDVTGFYNQGISFLSLFDSTFFVDNWGLNVALIATMIAGLAVFYVANKIFPFILIFPTLALMLTSAFIYNTFFWHYFFIYVYLICSLWLVYQRKIDLKFKYVPLILLAYLSLILIFWSTNPKHYNEMYNNQYASLAQYIKNNDRLNSSKILGIEMIPESLGVYLKKYNIDVYHLCAAEKYSNFYVNKNHCKYKFGWNAFDKSYDEKGTYLIIPEKYYPNNNVVRFYDKNKKDIFYLVLVDNVYKVKIFELKKTK